MVDSKWIANIYEADSAARSFDVTSELLAEEAGDIIAVDWTRDAGTRCQGKWMFNVTDENGKVLTSVVTATAAPAEVEPAMRDLHLRGAKPQVMYVDCECCGAWQAIVDKLWPDAYIVLDSFHAIRRLTQTTASTKHPWHADFCKPRTKLRTRNKFACGIECGYIGDDLQFLTILYILPLAW